MNNLFAYIKMGKEILTFGNIEIENNKFLCHKTPIFLGDVDIEKVVLSNKISFGEKNYKYFIGYLYNGNKVKPLNIMFPKTCTYVKSYYGQTKWMCFLIEDDFFFFFFSILYFTSIQISYIQIYQ